MVLWCGRVRCGRKEGIKDRGDATIGRKNLDGEPAGDELSGGCCCYRTGGRAHAREGRLVTGRLMLDLGRRGRGRLELEVGLAGQSL